MARHQRLRIYQRGDDETLWAECSTDPAHTHPYLFANEATAEEEADFVKGSASISEVSLQILDKRTVAADQDTGWFTAKLAVNGINAIIGGLAVWDEEVSTGVWRTLIRGVLGAPALVDDVTYSVSIRDIRERERKKKGFKTVTTSTVLPPGVVSGYGLRTDGSWLIPPVTPLAGHYAGNLIYIDDVDSDDVPHGLIATERKRRAGVPSNGVLDKVAVVWRAAGSADPWTTVSNMPYEEGLLIEGEASSALHTPLFWTSGGRTAIRGKPTDVEYISRVRLASAAPGDLPDHEQNIEFYVAYVGAPCEDYPQHLEGTFGQMLQTVFDLHDIDYDTARIAELIAGTPRGRVRITKPVDDMRAWIEKHLLRPMGLVPRLSETFELSPVSHNLPAASVSLVAIDANVIIDGDAHWVHSDRRVNAIDFDVIHEMYGADPLQETAFGDGITEDRRTYGRLHGVALNPQLEDRAKYDQDTVRAESTIFTALIEPYLPLTNHILEHRKALLFDRYPVGAQVFEALVFASIGEQLRIGTWASIAIPWLPDYTTGQRGTNRIGQVVRRVRVDEKAWRVWLEDGGPNSVPVAMPTVNGVVMSADGKATITVTPAAGTSARVEFAVGTVEPASTSGEWQTAGRADAAQDFELFNLPGGMTLYVRARGELEARRPSAWTTTVATAIPNRAALRAFRIRVNDDGSVTATWEHSAATAGMRLYYDAHTATEAPDLSLSVDVDADDGEYTFPAAVVDQAWFTVRGEPWSGFDGTNVTGTAGPTITTGTKVGPAPPTNLVLTFALIPAGGSTEGEATFMHWAIRATWTASPDPLLSHYELRQRAMAWDDVEEEWVPDGDWKQEPNPGRDDTAAVILNPAGAVIEVELRAVDDLGAKSPPISEVAEVGIFSRFDYDLRDFQHAPISETEDQASWSARGPRVNEVWVRQRTFHIDDIPARPFDAIPVSPTVLAGDANSFILPLPEAEHYTYVQVETRKADLSLGKFWRYTLYPRQLAKLPALAFVEGAGGFTTANYAIQVRDEGGETAGRLYVWVNPASDDSVDVSADADGYIDITLPTMVQPTAVFTLTGGGTAQLLSNIPRSRVANKVIAAELVMSDGRTTGVVQHTIPMSLGHLLDRLGAWKVGAIDDAHAMAEELRQVYPFANAAARDAVPPEDLEDGDRAFLRDDLTGWRWDATTETWSAYDFETSPFLYVPAISAAAIKTLHLATATLEALDIRADNVATIRLNADVLTALQAAIGTLSEISPGMGILTSGALVGAGGTLDLDAVGAAVALEFGGVQILADGTTTLAGELWATDGISLAGNIGASLVGIWPVLNVTWGMELDGSFVNAPTIFGTGFIGTNVETDTLSASAGVNFSGLPTSSAGLSAGDLWVDSGTVKQA